ncbi:MAG: PepSY domain-containing protein [Methylococcales bacterium]|nr:PepSY domain-containing protein [Methylococcales bacterium]
MNKTVIGSAIILAISSVVSVQAADKGIEKCVAAAQKQKQGQFVTLEKLKIVDSGKSVYELEIVDPNGFQWEFMCDAETGKIFESESEVESVNSLAFKAKMKVTEEDAKTIALKAYPGVISEVEYEIEENGDASYEFDIVNSKGVETKIEVDAATGKIIEVAIEEWQIGEEPNERR